EVAASWHRGLAEWPAVFNRRRGPRICGPSQRRTLSDLFSARCGIRASSQGLEVPSVAGASRVERLERFLTVGCSSEYWIAGIRRLLQFGLSRIPHPRQIREITTEISPAAQV